MKIVIAGYGVEGRASFEYWNNSNNDVSIADEREQIDAPTGVKTTLGADAFSKLNGFDMVVRSAGVAPRKIITNGKIWSATNEFFARCSVPIIGVTGTKGKGTTCSLITSILKAAGKTVHLVGNIGTPALEILPHIKPDDIIVYELSSFQLWDLEKSPHIAIILPIEPDHLDVHADFEEYLNAKANIRRFQNGGADPCLYHPTNSYAEKIAATPLVHESVEAWRGKSSIVTADRYAVANEDQVYVKGGYFCVQDRKICATEHLGLPGGHNLENACAAMSAVTELSISVTDEQFAKGLESFTGLPHRLKFVAEKHGIKWYDDSIATTPGSAIAAINSFAEPKTLLLGGHDKGSDYSELMQKCAEKNVQVIAYGANREQLKKLCDDANISCSVESGNMKAVVAHAAQVTREDNVVVLSPAAASFDMFKNYADRGDQFITAVQQLDD